jgi:hypothetical protein
MLFPACYTRLALGIALPTLALYLTPRPKTAPEEADPENIVTRARMMLGWQRQVAGGESGIRAAEATTHSVMNGRRE